MIVNFIIAFGEFQFLSSVTDFWQLKARLCILFWVFLANNRVQ